MIFMLVTSAIFLVYAAIITAVSIGWWKLKVFKNIETKIQSK
jgi:uncharacterized membrane protein (DUF106 family)